MSLYTDNAMLINLHYITEEEYQNLDETISSNPNENKYSFFSAVFNEGVIIYIWQYSSRVENANTNEKFPNLYKIIKLARENNIKYIQLRPLNIVENKNNGMLFENSIFLQEWN